MRVTVDVRLNYSENPGVVVGCSRKPQVVKGCVCGPGEGGGGKEERRGVGEGWRSSFKYGVQAI